MSLLLVLSPSIKTAKSKAKAEQLSATVEHADSKESAKTPLDDIQKSVDTLIF